MLASIKQEFMQNKKTVITLFLLAFLARIFFLILVNTYGTDMGSVINTKLDPKGTDGEYIQLALNIINHQTLSISPESPPKPNSARTPLYSLFLLPFIYFNAPYWVLALFLDFIISAFIAVFYILGKQVFNPKTVFYSAVFFALEPSSVLYSNSATVTENLFTPFFLGAFLLFAHFIIHSKPHYLYLGTIFLATATLIRPTSLYFFIFFPLLGFLAKFPIKKIAAQSIMAAIIFFSILSPLMIRNKIVLNSWQISSIQDYNLYTRIASSFCIYLKENCDHDFALSIKQLTSEHDYDIYNSHHPEKYRKIGLELIKNHPTEFPGFFISSIPRFFLKNNYVDIAQVFTKHNLYENNMPKISLIFLFRAFGKIIAFLFFFLILTSFILFFSKNSNKRLLALTALIVVYTAILSTPTDFVRYRMPILLPMTILALETLKLIYEKFKNQLIKN